MDQFKKHHSIRYADAVRDQPDLNVLNPTSTSIGINIRELYYVGTSVGWKGLPTLWVPSYLVYLWEHLVKCLNNLLNVNLFIFSLALAGRLRFQKLKYHKLVYFRFNQNVCHSAYSFGVHIYEKKMRKRLRWQNRNIIKVSLNWKKYFAGSLSIMKFSININSIFIERFYSLRMPSSYPHRPSCVCISWRKGGGRRAGCPRKKKIGSNRNKP